MGTEAIDEARLGAIGSAIGTLLVRLDAEPRPAPPSGAYIAVSGRVIPGKAIALLAIALLIGPLFAVGRRLINGGSPSRVGWSAALAVAVVGGVQLERIVASIPCAGFDTDPACAVTVVGGGVVVWVGTGRDVDDILGT